MAWCVAFPRELGGHCTGGWMLCKELCDCFGVMMSPSGLIRASPLANYMQGKLGNVVPGQAAPSQGPGATAKVGTACLPSWPAILSLLIHQSGKESSDPCCPW